MTYRDLALTILTKLSDTQLNSDVTIFTPEEEFFKATLEFSPEDDVLDKDHPFLHFE